MKTLIAETNYDAYFPKEYSSFKSPQSHCNLNFSKNNTCLYRQIDTPNVNPCSSNKDCNSDPTAYAVAKMAGVDALSTVKPIGLARDGRVIYGPFKIDGTTW